MDRELQILWSALLVYVAAGSLSIIGLVLRKKLETLVLSLLLIGLSLHGLSIGLRWERLGHGPYSSMFEILSSNVWSLTLVFFLACLVIKPIRATAAVVLPILFILMGWLLVSNPADGHLPPTYDTLWLYVHIGFGKIFLGCVIVAVGMAGIILLRSLGVGESQLVAVPNNRSLDELAYRFMALALIFDTLMLIAGSIWAQDAWGRYWAWDPLETWAFITWLALAFALHLRATYRPAPRISAVLVMGVFVIAFLTFFGVPFVSTAPHKGMV